ncbi:hypothetical protein [Phenylobacterium sp.]|jgi:outer membrane biosynthesis protein TonB|uniref:hypothetical protein n=1 Tax=Phenylobacterium sp. TaxID=1871053 RepID=UPI002F9351C0
MSDHDRAPDPADTAYVQAEAVLSDDEARAARRARVLAAVAADATTASPADAGPSRRGRWGQGGWLVAASVAGVSVLVAARLVLQAPAAPPVAPQPEARRPMEAPAAVEPASTAAPPTPANVPAPPPQPKPAVAAAAPPPPQARPPAAEAASPVEPRAAQPPAAPAAAQRAGVEEVVVTGSRRTERLEPAPEAIERTPPVAFPDDGPARLRAAAADGRTAEIRALLAGNVPVDAAGADGETALMKAVRARQPAAAALLRQRGASLDRRNRAGESVRDMVAAIGDARLDRALGLDR